MGNEHTRRQISEALHRDYEEFKNPKVNKRAVQKKLRIEKKKVVSKKFGL